MNNNRRDFIKKLGTATGAGFLATIPIMSMTEKINSSEITAVDADDKPFIISILQTTDVHCQVHPHDELFWENNKAVFRKTGGYAHLATYLQKERKKNPHTFLIDTGDMFQGSELAVKTTGKAMVPILNALGYDLYLPGNWEVVYFKKAMQTLLGSLNGPKVCANMYHDAGEGKKGELIFPPYYIWNVNIEECKGVDYIFGGDTHERVRIPIECKYAKMVEPGAFGSFVGKLNLTIQNGKVIKDEYSLGEVSADKNLPSAEISALIKNNEQPFAKDIYKIAGYSTVPLYRYFVVENTIDTLILDALKWEVTEVDIVLSNGFRFCPPKTTPDHTGNIPITDGFIYDMLPVDSTVRTGTVNGQQIKEWLEKELNNVFAKNAAERLGGWVIKFKGMQVSFNAFAEKGKRVKHVTVAGLPLDMNKTYNICACERDGDPADMLCRMKGVSNAKNTILTLHTVLKEYLAANSPVTPTPAMNAKILDAPQTLLTQVTGVDYQFT